ncbi:hypothetical protein T492DRAFT_1092000 [Pavlovales sp. CCMP2436]|nr:hypothetical protein T492DRAFT_1092000 [Pavlovales sp. CCMP2436]
MRCGRLSAFGQAHARDHGRLHARTRQTLRLRTGIEVHTSHDVTPRQPARLRV